MSDTLRINNLFTTSIGYSTLTGSTITTNSLSLSTLTVSSINSGAPGVAAFSTLNVSTLNATSTITGSTINALTGRMGIGTSAPEQALDIVNSASATMGVRLQSQFSAGYVSMGAVLGVNSYIGLQAGVATTSALTTPTLCVTNANNVGIGTANPQQPLSLFGSSSSMMSITSSSADANIYYSCTGAGGRNWYAGSGGNGSGGGNGNFYIYDATAVLPRLVVNPVGNVGIGITNPGYLLDVNGTLNIRGSFTVNGVAVATGTGSVWTVGASNAIFYSAGNTCLFRNRLVFSNAINDFNHSIYNNSSNWDSEGSWDGMKFNVYAGAWFRVNNANGTVPPTAMFMNTSGYVGIGLTTPAAPLHVNGFATTTSNAPATFFAAGSTVLATPGTSQFTSIYASNVIQTATGFVAGSDRRIKKNITPIADSLAKLEALNIVRYDRINFREEGADAGVIAQDVQAILPHAVSTGTSYIPNIYQCATHSIQNTTVRIIVDSIAVDVKDNTKVRLYVCVADSETEYETKLFHLTGNSFDVAMWSNYSPDNKVFVYGTEVDDFLSVDKDQIGMLAAAGVKELMKQNAEQAEKITTLESQLLTVLSRLNAAGIA